jgi:hypothetical protein
MIRNLVDGAAVAGPAIGAPWSGIPERADRE